MEDTQINWNKVRTDFEKEMVLKLSQLPGHREVSEDLRPFRSLISHELPETSSIDLFKTLIDLLLSGKPVDLQQIRKKYLDPELIKEKHELYSNAEEFNHVKKMATEWVEENLSEERLQKEWNEHKTWLPSRYTIYKDPNTPFQIIAADTLARYYLIKSNDRIPPRVL